MRKSKLSWNEERERDSFSRLDAFYTIGVIGVENKKKRKEKEKKLLPAIFPPVMQYSWAGTRSLSKRKSRAQTGYRIRWNLLANVTIVGVAYARRNFKESSGPITAATTFASVATTQNFHRYYGARWLGQIVKRTFRSSAQGKERNEGRNESFGIRALVRGERLCTELFIERVFILLRGGCETLIPSFFFGRETQEGDLEWDGEFLMINSAHYRGQLLEE